MALFAALTLAACGSDDEDDVSTASTTTTASITSTSTTSTTSEPTTTTTAQPATTTTTTARPTSTSTAVFFLNGDKLHAVYRSVPASTMPATAAVTALLAGPTAGERQGGLSTTIPTGTVLNGIRIDKGTAWVDLSAQFESGGGTLSMTARLAQVVFTVTQYSSVSRVWFQLDGKDVRVFSGEGLVLDKASTRADFEDLMPAVFVLSPTWGSTIRSPARIRGTANVFEAVFRIEITDWDGRIVADKVVMASSGTGTRGTFDVTLSYETLRSGLGAVIVSSESPKDGSRINVVETPVYVRQSAD